MKFLELLHMLEYRSECTKYQQMIDEHYKRKNKGGAKNKWH